MATNVNVQFSASIKDLIEATNSVKSAIDSVAETANKATSTLKGFAEFAGVALSVEGVKRFVESEAKLGEQTERIMGQLGISAERVGVLGGMAKLTETDLDSLTTSFERMTLNVQKSIKDAFSPAAQGLKVLHLNARDLIGLPADQYFRRLAEAIARFNPSLNLTNAIMAVGGRGVAQIIETLRLAGESWDEWEQKIKATGVTLTNMQAQAFAKTNIAIELLKMNIQGLGNAMFSQLEPAIDAVIKQMTGFVAEVRDSIKEGGAWGVVLSGLSETLKVIAAAFAGVAAMIRFLSVEVKAFWDTTAENGKEVGEKLKADLDKIAHDFQDTLSSLFGTPRITVHAKLKLDNAGAMNEGAQSAFNDEVKQIQERIKMQEEQYKSEVEEINAAAKMHDLSEDEKTRALIVAVRTRVAAIQGEIQQEIDLYKSVGKSVGALELEKSKAAQKGADDIKKINSQAAEEYTKEWTSALTAVQSAFDSQLKGLLAGTTSWATAMKHILGDLVMDVIKVFEKIAIEKAASGLTSLTGTGPMSALSTAFGSVFGGGAKAAGAGAGGAGQDVAVSTNTQALGVLTTQITGTLTPAILGLTTALGGAAGAEGAGSVAAVGAILPLMATGTNMVMKTGVAMLHQGETVVPADATARGNGPYRGPDAFASDVPDFHLHVHAIDTQTAADFIDKNIRPIARKLNDHYRSNFGDRPSGW